MTQIDDLDAKKTAVTHQEQSWYKKKNLPKESTEKNKELEEIVEKLKNRVSIFVHILIYIAADSHSRKNHLFHT